MGVFIFDERLVHDERHCSFDLEESLGTELMSHFFPFCFVFGPVDLQPCAISGCHYCIEADWVGAVLGKGVSSFRSGGRDVVSCRWQ